MRRRPACLPDGIASGPRQALRQEMSMLLDYRRRAPGSVQAHPSEEHLLPLFAALGAAGDDAQAERFHAGGDEHVLAMDAWTFIPATRGAPQ